VEVKLDDIKELKSRLDLCEEHIKALVNLLITAGTVAPEKLPDILQPLVNAEEEEKEDLFA
jgi:hypothetical protein